MRTDAEIWEDWGYQLDRLCVALSRARRKAGAMRKNFMMESDLNARALSDVQEETFTARALIEGLYALYEEAGRGQEE